MYDMSAQGADEHMIMYILIISSNSNVWTFGSFSHLKA